MRLSSTRSSSNPLNFLNVVKRAPPLRGIRFPLSSRDDLKSLYPKDLCPPFIVIRAPAATLANPPIPRSVFFFSVGAFLLVCYPDNQRERKTAFLFIPCLKRFLVLPQKCGRCKTLGFSFPPRPGTPKSLEVLIVFGIWEVSSLTARHKCRFSQKVASAVRPTSRCRNPFCITGYHSLPRVSTRRLYVITTLLKSPRFLS